jgi:hypothetical protein
VSFPVAKPHKEQQSMDELATDGDNTSLEPAYPSRLLRLIVVILGLAAWFSTQSLISQRPSGTGVIGDGLLQMLAPIHSYFWDNTQAANALLISSSAVIDLLGIFLLLWSILGPSIRPFFGLMILFSLRQICQALCALPAPEGMIWRDPGFPSLLVTYGVSNDLFFSGHTAIAVYGAVEIGRLGRNWVPLAIAIAVFQTVTVLVLYAHYTMDVFTGIIAALYIAGVAARCAPSVDRWLIRLFSRESKV